ISDREAVPDCFGLSELRTVGGRHRPCASKLECGAKVGMASMSRGSHHRGLELDHERSFAPSGSRNGLRRTRAVIVVPPDLNVRAVPSSAIAVGTHAKPMKAP